ncbi:MAG TPA: VTT domain-containing protein [Gemmatimonadaceae bacterium]|nr:VTT domain-containing protein [Gemmatimonadaceae bacterium]
MTLPSPSDELSVTPPRPGLGARFRRWIVGMLATLHRWAESGWGGAAVASWGFLQSSVVPGPTDALLVPLGISDPARVYRLAAWALLGAVLGGLAAYLIGAHALEGPGRSLFGFMGMSEDAMAASRSMFERRGWQLVVLSTVSPLSTKMVCLAAGMFGVPFGEFLLALTVGRAARFVVIASVLRFAGPTLLRRLQTWVTPTA